LEKMPLWLQTVTYARLVSEPPSAVNVDGEIVERTPLEVEILPDALRVYAA
jgi:diacylglycerol kinase family enzyme